MRTRVGAWGVVAAALVAGLLFAPVFGLGALVLPLVCVAAVAVLADELVVRKPSLVAWRPLFVLLAGLLVVFEVVVARGLPGLGDLEVFGDGVLNGWRAALESTWPARPEPRLVLFVPLLVLLACVLGLELLRRTGPLLALLPSAAVLVLAQAFVAMRGADAIAWALAYAAVSGLVLGSTVLSRTTLRATSAAAVVAALVAGGALMPALGTPLSLHDERKPPELPAALVNPLDEMGGRLADPEQAVFRVRTQAEVDRWTLAVFDRFDGVTWHRDNGFRALGAELPADPEITVPTRLAQATITRDAAAPLWLPTQQRTAAVHGLAPAVDPETGVLITATPTGTYDLVWRAPQTRQEDYASYSLAARSADLNDVPEGLGALAKDAVADGGPSFASALAMEKWFQDNYQVAEGDDLPTGRAYPQLLHFLTTSKRGTTEQFASAYVVLARLQGIPARLAVGFRDRGAEALDGDGNRVVRNKDAFAWPEIAVAGAGWVPLDPSGTVAAVKQDTARPKPPEQQKIPDTSDTIKQDEVPPTAPVQPTTPEPEPTSWWLIAAFVLGVPLVLAGCTVPVTKVLRRRARRRGDPRKAVVGAAQEVHDVLREHGLPVTTGMTMREIARETADILDPRVSDELSALGGVVDHALWSGRPPDSRHAERAWQVVGSVRKGVRVLPRKVRLRAAVAPARRR
jgi:protein-glutamine gamma-glutamyltransferase